MQRQDITTEPGRLGFFDLPAELRNRIYHNVLTDPDSVELKKPTCELRKALGRPHLPIVKLHNLLQPPLTLASHQTQQEALPVYLHFVVSSLTLNFKVRRSTTLTRMSEGWSGENAVKLVLPPWLRRAGLPLPPACRRIVLKPFPDTHDYLLVRLMQRRTAGSYRWAVLTVSDRRRPCLGRAELKQRKELNAAFEKTKEKIRTLVASFGLEGLTVHELQMLIGLWEHEISLARM